MSYQRPTVKCDDRGANFVIPKIAHKKGSPPKSRDRGGSTGDPRNAAKTQRRDGLSSFGISRTAAPRSRFAMRKRKAGGVSMMHSGEEATCHRRARARNPGMMPWHCQTPMAKAPLRLGIHDLPLFVSGVRLRTRPNR